MRHLKILASALAVVLFVVMATDYVAMAATGKPLILGHVNKSGKTTTIKSTKGAALSLKTKSSQPPLKVNSNEAVKNLNADLLDGKSASQLGVRSRVERFTLNGTSVGNVTHIITNVKAGTYLVNYGLYLNVNASVTGYCYASNDQFSYAGFASSPALSGLAFAVSGSGVITFTSTADLYFNCYFSSPTNVSTFDQVALALTPIDSVS